MGQEHIEIHIAEDLNMDHADNLMSLNIKSSQNMPLMNNWESLQM